MASRSKISRLCYNNNSVRSLPSWVRYMDLVTGHQMTGSDCVNAQTDLDLHCNIRNPFFFSHFVSFYRVSCLQLSHSIQTPKFP